MIYNKLIGLGSHQRFLNPIRYKYALETIFDSYILSNRRLQAYE